MDQTKEYLKMRYSANTINQLQIANLIIIFWVVIVIQVREAVHVMKGMNMVCVLGALQLSRYFVASFASCGRDEIAFISAVEIAGTSAAIFTTPGTAISSARTMVWKNEIKIR